MPQIETMSPDEKLAISNKALDLFDAGDKKGFSRIIRTTPMPPYLAKIFKEKMGVDFLINGRLEPVGSGGGIWTELA